MVIFPAATWKEDKKNTDIHINITCDIIACIHFLSIELVASLTPVAIHNGEKIDRTPKITYLSATSIINFTKFISMLNNITIHKTSSTRPNTDLLTPSMLPGTAEPTDETMLLFRPEAHPARSCSVEPPSH